jgi:uncharacterized protein (TIGR02594 family)
MTLDILAIQQRLSALGFNPGPIDGVRGPRTDAAVVAFKRSIGFLPRPYIGPLTLAALMDSAPKSEIPWMAEAIRVKGLHEVRDYARLRGWMDRAVFPYDPREVAWCGSFVATCLLKWSATTKLPDNPLGARNWSHYGLECTPQMGAIMVFWRGSRSGWKGHVGFYWGEDDTAFHILGGNQSNAVTVARVSKDRFLAARQPLGHRLTGGPIYLSKSGVPLTTNEA